jgi:hypothetical protein
MRNRVLWLMLMVAVVGLMGWSCSSNEGGTSSVKLKPGVTGTAAPTVTAKSDATQGENPVATLPEEEPAVTTTVAAVDGMVPLRLHPKRPENKPTEFNVPLDEHIEPLGTLRSPVMIPEGSVNLAFKKPVTSSTTFFITGDLSIITDGETKGEEGYYVELGPAKQWVQIDLQQESRIYAVAFYHYSLQTRAFHDVIVQISDDPNFIKDTKTVFNNDYDNSSGLGIGKDQEYLEDYRGRSIPVAGVSGRYVRLYSNGDMASDRNFYIEVEVWGKPAK